MKIFYSLTAFILPLLLLAHGGDTGKYTKEKRISKAYSVNADAGISIDNSFGPVFVTTWDEDKIEIQVVIKVSGNSEKWVDSRLATIDVDLKAMTNLVSARTRIGSGVKNASGSSSMEISYTVKIPKMGSAQITNKYGDIIATDLNGAADLTLKYGNLKLARLNNQANRLDLEYCGSVAIGRVRAGAIKADYSKLSIGEFDVISVESRYSDFSCGNGDNLRLDSNYGKFKLERVNNLEGSGNYMTVNVETLSGNLGIRASYTTVRVANIAATAGNTAISGGYNTVDLNFNNGYAFDFEVSGKYTKVQLDDALQLNNRDESNKSRLYKGFYRKPGENRLSVSGEYGNISIHKN